MFTLKGIGVEDASFGWPKKCKKNGCFAMALYIASLNSGSNGNCYYIGNEHEAILVDAGISCRETEKRLKQSGLTFDKIKAIFISHEHTDHTRGVEVISKKHRVPVYISTEAYRNSRLNLEDNLRAALSPQVPVVIGSLTISAFPKLHDAADPFSFTISNDGITVGVFTDIGSPCESVIKHFGLCHAAFLEANYDDEMLDKGDYPFYLKNRIRGDHGHLSNEQALELFSMHKPPFMTHLLLSHLSQDNNNPDLVSDLFLKHADGARITVASRYEPSPVFCIGSPAQMSLF